MHIASIGVDLGKTTFHLVALAEQGKVVVRKKFSRKQPGLLRVVEKRRLGRPSP
jgi:predicted NBD/HSP70 family sugar kinase